MGILKLNPMKKTRRHLTTTLLAAACFAIAMPSMESIADNSSPPAADIAPIVEQQNNSNDDRKLPACCNVDQNQSPVDPSIEQARPDESVEPDDLLLPTAKARKSEWIASTNREPFDLDFKMINQDNQPLVLSDLVGRPLVLSFIFTRCPNPNLCPMITFSMASLQRDLKAAGLAQHVNLALLTYDPVYDTPEKLKRYAQDRGLGFANAMMLQPAVDRFPELLREFQIGVDYRSDGSIGHFIELLIIDHKGQFVRDYQGNLWDNASVLADLKRLVAEQHAAHQAVPLGG